MHAWIQAVIDVLIVVMASILVLFVLALVILHILTTTNNKQVERIKRRIMRMLSVTQDLDFLRGQIMRLLAHEDGIAGLRDIRGIRSNRGTIAMTLVVEEVPAEQKEALREIILADEWYLAHIHRRMASSNADRVGVFTKLIAELRLPGFEQDIIRELRRWPKRADNQEIGLLALFMCGCEDELVELLGDSSFRLIISFRSLQELFVQYTGNKAALYRRLLRQECDLYITRACIRGIGVDGLEELCEDVLPYLESTNTNLLIDAVRTLGKLRYAPAVEAIRAFTRHEAWTVRSTAASALFDAAPESCRDDLLRCLCDSEWWVRFHAAEALSALPNPPDLETDIAPLDDRFAYEMYRFMLERNALLAEGKAS